VIQLRHRHSSKIHIVYYAVAAHHVAEKDATPEINLAHGAILTTQTVLISIFPSATNGIPHSRVVLTSNFTETVELHVVSTLLV
jgi:hypothetical protein